MAISGREIRPFAFFLAIAAFCGAGFQQIDMLAVKARLDPVTAGQYGAASQLAKVIGFLIIPFGTLSLPFLTSLHQQGKPLRRPLLRICAYFLLLAAPPLIFFWLRPELVLSICGKRFVSAGAAAALAPLAAGLLIGGQSSLIASAFAAANRFSFLWIYTTGLAAESFALFTWGQTPLHVAYIALAAKVCVLVAMGVWFVVSHPPAPPEINKPLEEV